MITKSADEIVGFEFDWLASDADGFVAFFSTAGGGYAPVRFLQDTDAHDSAIAALLSVPASTRVRFAPDLDNGVQNIWRLVSERGVFAFDGSPNDDNYRLVAAPEVPRHVDGLPASAQAVARLLAFPKLHFSELLEISGLLLRQMD